GIFHRSPLIVNRVGYSRTRVEAYDASRTALHDGHMGRLVDVQVLRYIMTAVSRSDHNGILASPGSPRLELAGVEDGAVEPGNPCHRGYFRNSPRDASRNHQVLAAHFPM